MDKVEVVSEVGKGTKVIMFKTFESVKNSSVNIITMKIYNL